MDYHGGDIPIYRPTAVSDVYACQNLCRKFEKAGCRFFTALGGAGSEKGRKQCYLKGGPESWSDKRFSFHGLAGPRDCREFVSASFST